MTALTIRDVSEDAVRTMKIRAAQADQLLQAYLRSLIEREAARPTVAETVEQARRQATADISTTDILAAIDEGLNLTLTVIDCSAMIELLGSKHAGRRCRRPPGDRGGDSVRAIRARRRGHLSASWAHARTENLWNEKPTPRSPTTAHSPSNGRTCSPCGLV